jgi:hypothetical protein
VADCFSPHHTSAAEASPGTRGKFEPSELISKAVVDDIHNALRLNTPVSLRGSRNNVAKTPPFDFVAQSKGREAEILLEVTMHREEPAPVPMAASIRWWRLRPWSRNHLMRPSDRYEAALVLLSGAVVCW